MQSLETHTKEAKDVNIVTSVQFDNSFVTHPEVDHLNSALPPQEEPGPSTEESPLFLPREKPKILLPNKRRNMCRNLLMEKKALSTDSSNPEEKNPKGCDAKQQTQNVLQLEKFKKQLKKVMLCMSLQPS